MALESTMVPIGTPLPDVTLPDLDGNLVNLHKYAGGQPLLVVFACNHCPYVRHIEQLLATTVGGFAGLRTAAINANDAAGFPEDGPDGMREQVRRAGWSFPYLIDATQASARSFAAACTPDLFLYNAAGRLAYRGAFDASTPRNGQPLTGELLRAAITDVMAGRPVPEPHRPSMGCGIKWKSA